jgi:hypothetical protein
MLGGPAAGGRRFARTVHAFPVTVAAQHTGFRSLQAACQRPAEATSAFSSSVSGGGSQGLNTRWL